MKIALIGTHGVGKTTLCYELAARLKRLDRHVDLVTEVARDCPLPINEDTTLDAQSWILHTQCARELAAVAKGGDVICDRSVLDNYAYLVHAMGRRPELDAWISRWCMSYTALFKVPLWQEARFDGTRATDAEFQSGVDRTLDELTRQFEIQVPRLSTDEPDGWVDEILDHLGIPKLPPQADLFST